MRPEHLSSIKLEFKSSAGKILFVRVKGRMATFLPQQRGRFPNLSEEKLEAELNKVNPDVKVIISFSQL